MAAPHTRASKRRPAAAAASSSLPYLPTELIAQIIHQADAATVITMHSLSQRFFVECHLALDAVLSRQPMATYLSAHAKYHQLLLLGRAAVLADAVSDTASTCRAVIQRGRCHQLSREHPHALLLTALIVAELQRRHRDGSSGASVPWAATWERLCAAAGNSSSRVKWISFAATSELLITPAAPAAPSSATSAPVPAALPHSPPLHRLVNRVEQLTDAMGSQVRRLLGRGGVGGH